MQVSLVVVPGKGQTFETLAEGTTLSAFAASKNLDDRTFTVNGVSVPADQWSSTILEAGDDIFATKSVKGA